MNKAQVAGKVECINPNTGHRMMIDAGTYELFSKAIYHSLKSGKALTYTQLVEDIKDYFKKTKAPFGGSVEWYAVTIKKDMEANGIIQVYKEKGRQLHRLSK